MGEAPPAWIGKRVTTPIPSPQGGGEPRVSQGERLRGGAVVLPAGGVDARRTIASLARAAEHGLGDFESVELLVAQGASSRAILLDAARQAANQKFDWLLAVTSEETLAPDIFVKLHPALRVYDAVWGGAALAALEGAPPPKLERITRLAAQDFPGFFHAALRWWIGPAHFVRPGLALDALCAPDMSAWYAQYMLRLWKRGSAYKTAQCLTHFHCPLPSLAEADRTGLTDFLEKEPVFMRLRYGALTLSLPYTGLNPVIEREQMRGLFFEHEELTFLAERLPRGLNIVDVGANTGNHTLFFAAVMQAVRVVPIEPLPRSASAIRAVVAENRLANVDLSCLGKAVGAETGRMRAVPSTTAGLGATHFVPDADGEIAVERLDALVSGPVDFIKIDVEGMEMQALAGASALIAAQHPILYVEVVDESVGEFMAWVDRHGYRVEKLFPDKTHCNYLLVPKQRKTGVRG
jgi:FkbM family methyltransferase